MQPGQRFEKKGIYAAILGVLGLCIFIYLLSDYSGSEKKGAPPPRGTNHSGHTEQSQPPQAAVPDPQDEPSVVEIPEDRMQLIGVKTAAAQVKDIQKTIRTVGIVQYDERRLATVNTKFEGWIEKLYVDYTGRYIRKGEALAELYSPELLSTQQELINLLRWQKERTKASGGDVGNMVAADARSIIDAARQRLRLWDISEEQIKKIEQSGSPLRTVTIYSPVNGYVVQKNALRGMRIGPGEKLFDIADLSSVWVLSEIFEYELPLVKAGERATISLSSLPGKEFKAPVEYVYPTISGETRSAKVRFTLPNPGNLLKPQMYTNVEVRIPLGKRLVIPDSAVLDSGKRQIVYIDKGEGTFEPRDITVGVRTDGMVEITSGLKAGEKVATSANFLIDSEARLKGIVK